MQSCMLITNKATQVASYLEHRSILRVVEEYRSLSEIDLEKLAIIDVDKFMYIYYSSKDSDLSLRADMNKLRNLMNSAFFHISEALFILVDNENPVLEDLIKSALRDTDIINGKLEIIQHTGSLMLSDVGKYVSGSASGQTTSSTYKEVYIREADKEEQERFMNTSAGLTSVLPVLTDMATMYTQRASVEAVSSGRVVSEVSNRPNNVKGFTHNITEARGTISAFIVSGDRWSESYKAVDYLLKYYKNIGKRCLVVNIDSMIKIEDYIDKCNTYTLMDIRLIVSPAEMISTINIRYDQIMYVIEFLGNIQGIEEYIFYTNPGNFKNIVKFIKQLSNNYHSMFVVHNTEDSIVNYLDLGMSVDALFINFEILSKEFDLKKYKEDLKNSIVAVFPNEDVDYSEFYALSIGGDKFV